jgi:hypothetical protein
MPTDTTLTIRCPYCMAGIEFRPMIAYKDGRFVCRDCAHTVRPGVPEYECTCRRCLRRSRAKQENMTLVGKSLARCLPIRARLAGIPQQLFPKYGKGDRHH